MPTWVIILLTVMGILIVCKLLFAFSLVSVFPITQGAMPPLRPCQGKDIPGSCADEGG